MIRLLCTTTVNEDEWYDYAFALQDYNYSCWVSSVRTAL